MLVLCWAGLCCAWLGYMFVWFLSQQALTFFSDYNNAPVREYHKRDNNEPVPLPLPILYCSTATATDNASAAGGWACACLVLPPPGRFLPPSLPPPPALRLLSFLPSFLPSYLPIDVAGVYGASYGRFFRGRGSRGGPLPWSGAPHGQQPYGGPYAGKPTYNSMTIFGWCAQLYFGILVGLIFGIELIFGIDTIFEFVFENVCEIRFIIVFKTEFRTAF